MTTTRRSFSASGRRLVLVALCLLALAGGAALILEDIAIPHADDDDKPGDEMFAPSRATERDGVTVITLDGKTQQRGGIETAAVTPAPSQEIVFAYGSVLDAGALTDLGNRYLEAQAQLQTASAKLSVSRTAFDRAKALYRERKIIALAQLEGAEGAFGVDQAALVAAQSRVAMLAASALQSWGPLIGQALLDRSALAIRLIEQHEYLVRVTLFPGVSLTAPPATATATTTGGPTIPLRFVSPTATTNPKLQGISYFYSAAADSGALPGLNLNVSLPIAVADPGTLVPETAVVWLQGKTWIYLRTAADTFIRREIAVSRQGPDRGYVVAGLPPDAQAVVRGAQMLLSEEFRAQVPVED